MKARELMIGDWVKETLNGKYRFSQVDGEMLLIMIHYDASIEPIPLTAEILEMNGFKDSGVLSYEFYDGYHVFLDAEKRSVHAGALWFVHQLQHALRLCGLNELADNFKV